MKNLINILKILSAYIEDFFILTGLFLIIIATFLLSEIIGLYVLGFILIGIGVMFTRIRPKGRRLN